MKHLAFLSFAIASLLAPITVHAQTACVRFPSPPNPEAEVRYLMSHPGVRVCPGPNPNLQGQANALQQGAANIWAAKQRLICSMGGRVC
jgi:hypothetical protein